MEISGQNGTPAALSPQNSLLYHLDQGFAGSVMSGRSGGDED